MEDIQNKELVQFSFEGEGFNIYFDQNKWVAEADDEDEFPDLIILEDSELGIFFDSDIDNIFNSGFNLTIHHFNLLKKTISEKIII